MTESNSLLDDEEIDFLLARAETQTADEVFDPTDGDDAKATIRGDLDNISLGDIFQTLSISKMRGILKVFNPLETRLIYFAEGTVRLMNANRKGTRRIGQRLVRCGVLTTAQLRQALLEQKKTGAPLGETLIDLGFMTDDELSSVLNNQLEEDLHNIFIWGSGSFEFYKNKPDDDEILEELNKTPGFEVNDILLEAARRRDEWSHILECVGSVHAIPVIPADVEFPEMTGNALVVCESVDNFSTISDLAETTMLGLFHCAKAVSNLKLDGLVGLANPQLTLELAQDATSKQDTKRALQLCQNLRHHASNLDFELCEKLASVLEECREPRLSANILLECAKTLEEIDHRLGIAERALGVDRHAIAVMEFIRHEMRVAERTELPEYTENLGRLCEALSSDGDDEQALEIFGELEQMSSDTVALLSRKAKLLQRAGREQEALECLLELRSEYEKDADKPRLIRIYEQILKLDPSQRDVAKALRVLRVGKAKTRLHRLYVVVAVGAILFGSYYAWHWSETRDIIEAKSVEIRGFIEKRDIGRATSTLAAVEAQVGEREIWRTLRDEINNSVRKIKAAAAAKLEKEHIKGLSAVSDELQKGNLEKALELYRTLMQTKGAEKLVRRIAQSQLHRITKRLEGIRDTLKNGLPNPPHTLARYEMLVASRANLEEKGKLDTSLARSMLVIAENSTVKELWPAKDRANAQAFALEVQSLRQSVTTLTQLYRARIKKIEKHRRLDPVIIRAKRAEDHNDFAEALKLYSQLLSEFSGHPDLAPKFRDLVAKYSSILRHLKLLERAVEKSNFRDARTYYLHLKRSYKEYAWGSMIKLPLSVITTPPGASVFFNGNLKGKSPITVRYRPDDKNRVEIQLDGFGSQKTLITGDRVGIVRSVLNRTPDWVLKTRGAVDRRGVAGSTHRLFIVDRTGAVSAWSTKERTKLWRYETGDLSGLLTRPVLYQQLVIVGSLDGTLRAIDRSSGSVVWSLPDLPCESRPIVYKTQLIIASGRSLVFIEMKRKKKKVIHRIPLSSTVQQDLLLVNKSVLVTQDDGKVRLISIKARTDEWKPIQLDGGLMCQPLIVGRTLILATDEGVLSAHRLTAGTRIWRRIGLGELHWRPVTDGKQVFIAAQPTPELSATIYTFSATTGVPGPRYHTPENEFWSTHPALIEGKLLVGTRSGLFRVLDARTLKLLYHIRGDGAASARPLTMPSGATLFTFENNEIQVFPGMK